MCQEALRRASMRVEWGFCCCSLGLGTPYFVSTRFRGVALLARSLDEVCKWGSTG